MFRGRFLIVRILAALLLTAILVGGGFAVYRLGFAQGYTQGLAQTAGEGQQFMPGFPFHRGFVMPHFGFGFFPFMSLCGLGLLGLFALFFVAALFRPRRWWGPAGMHPMHDHPWGPPPWAREQPPTPKDQPSTEPSASEAKP